MAKQRFYTHLAFEMLSVTLVFSVPDSNYFLFGRGHLNPNINLKDSG